MDPGAGGADLRLPTNVVVVLLDSLNRHLVGAYGSGEFDTPNLDRLARRAVRFDRHRTGSLPCMPARHDLLCGTLDFLWRPWGSLELWDVPLTRLLRPAGVTTMLVSDHPHLFETGGENYHCEFTAWEYLRGHEDDPWRTAPDPSWLGAPALAARPGPLPRHYDTSRTWFRDEADFPGARTMAAAADWLEHQAPHADRFLLFVDEFDPHEPFDVPAPWAGRYDPEWDGPSVIWPPYAADAVARGILDERTARHLRANYGAKLSFIDHWLGRILDVFDRCGRWDDTALVLCTDHGHYLGERDIFGKPAVPVYREMGHLPLLIAWPGQESGVVDALTTTVDLFATVCDVFGVEPERPAHGTSLVPLLEGRTTAVREWAVTGVWGREVHVTDGHRSYARAAHADNLPLSMWSNRWSTMPVHALPDLRLPLPDHRARLETMPGTDIPVIRQPFEPGDPLPYWAGRPGRPGRNLLFDLDEDPGEIRDLAGTPAEAELAELLRHALDHLQAPDDQYQRLGLR
jgi:arylsulfatase A-like enzyme